ncbi:MAG: hypothetical protein H0T89_07775 [Deltaproteobacteria bacterium]|nr:hypothetical protein [Deltaproteobacteria bacterium]MDQ3297037.1 hypothetical protein [Myxococcota bacterium]
MKAVICTLVFAAGCGGTKTDDCQKFADKSAPVLRGIAKEAGKELTKEHLATMVKTCREKGNAGDQAMFECVLGASGEAAVADCWEQGMKGYLDDTKGGGANRVSREQRDLERLGKNAKAYFAANGGYPEGSAGPTAECCKVSPHSCKPDPAVWTGVWKALDFSIDRTYHAQYSYEGTPTSFVAKALVNMDCDEDVLEVVVTGSVDASKAPIIETAVAGKD